MEYRPNDIVEQSPGNLSFKCVWCGRTLTTQSGTSANSTMVHLLHHQMKLMHLLGTGTERRPEPT